MPEIELTDVEAEKAQLANAILFGLMTGASQPYPIPVPEAATIADLLWRCGVRQTDQRDADLDIPTWISERVREQAVEVTPTPDMHAVQDTPRVREAPPCPKKIPKKLLGVVITPS